MRLTPSACLLPTMSASATAADVVGAATSSPPAERASRIISAGLLVPHPFWSVLPELASVYQCEFTINFTDVDVSYAY